jgi:hypothetical protein
VRIAAERSSDPVFWRRSFEPTANRVDAALKTEVSAVFRGSVHINAIDTDRRRPEEPKALRVVFAVHPYEANVSAHLRGFDRGAYTLHRRVDVRTSVEHEDIYPLLVHHGASLPSATRIVVPMHKFRPKEQLRPLQIRRLPVVRALACTRPFCSLVRVGVGILPEQPIIEEIGGALSACGFNARDHAERLADLTWSALWIRKTWNTNRAVALFRLPDDARHAGELSQSIKFQVGKHAGYFPFLYGLGLQLVWLGQAVGQRAEGLSRFVDRVDNQRCIVQSIHVADLADGTSVSVRTWGQLFTGRFQDAIEAALRLALQRAN